ncbi:hypothetical protein MKW98_000847 [Papaver atlanticum]|uniref:Uncharacterized protein n=1 Tax=Papaver atlanticum TaxID=357466 RepID=A0AAD4SD85_9MAGN|nr:hypothetical protein MKW98_000847 [Papaver atlanticum]
MHAVQMKLAYVNTALGRKEESVVNVTRCLELKLHVLEPDSKEMGVANIQSAEAYVAVLNFKEGQEKYADSKSCLEISPGILYKIESEAPVEAAEAYTEIAML